MMNFELIRNLEALILPPSGLITLGLIGVLFSFTKSGKQLMGISMLLLYLMSTPYISEWLNSRLTHQYAAVTPQQLQSGDNKPEALVLLGGGYYGESVEYGDTAIGPFFAERIRYTAWLAKQTGLPVIISSGRSDAPAAVRILQQEYGINNVLQEDRSWTTDDNARNLKHLLEQEGISRIGLITHAWHMPRAMWSIESNDIDALALPMGLLEAKPAIDDYANWLPSMTSLVRSRNVMHEFFGLVWYQMRSMWNTLTDLLGVAEPETRQVAVKQSPPPQQLPVHTAVDDEPVTHQTAEQTPANGETASQTADTDEITQETQVNQAPQSLELKTEN